MHAVPLFLPRMHRSRAHLVSDGLASPQDIFLLLFPFPCLRVTAVGFKPVQLIGEGCNNRGGFGGPSPCFLLLWRWNQNEQRVPNAALVQVVLGEPAWPQHPAAGFT